MSTINIDLAADTILNVMIGQQDENEVREVVFDFSGWYTTYGSGTISLAIQRPKDEWPYEGTLTVDSTNHKATWEISETDTAYAGTGQIQLSYKVGDAKKKSVVYRFTCHKSLGALGNVVTPVQIQTFIDEVEEALQTMDGKLDDMEDEITDVKADLGDLNNLETTAKNNLVAAINEAAQSGGSGTGMSEDFKQALHDILEKVAYIDEDGQDYLDALDNAMWPPADLVSISAAYTQSGTVYDTDTLDSLKSDLVVTATYDNGTTETISDYTLSGTLTEGTSTITVSYGGKTTTFNVTVTAKVITTITASSDGVGFGSMDNTKPTFNPPYVSNTNKSRIHYLGTNNLGVAINPNKTYKISITTDLTTCQVGVLSFNNTAKTNITNLQAVNNANKADAGWQSLTQSSPYIYTPPASINGEEPVMAWLNFRRSTGDSNWSDINDSIFPVTFEEL